MSLDALLTFFLASCLLGLAPGPDNLFVLFQSALYGRRAGILVTLGLCTGLLVHTSAVALGLSALFAASSLVFTVLKVLGAAYLLYLAWQAFRATASAEQAAEAARLSDSALYRRGILMNLTNPKVALFFLAFLPQFANPQVGNITVQLFLLGAVFILAALIVFTGIAVLSASLTTLMQSSPRPRLWLNRLAGSVFVLLAVKLLTSSRAN